MAKLIHLIVFYALFTQSYQFQHEDDNNSGIILEPSEIVNLHRSTYNLTYSIDISMINILSTQMNEISNICADHSSIKFIKSRLPKNNTFWFIENSTYEPQTNVIQKEPYLFTHLREKYNSFMNNEYSSNRCQSLHSMYTDLMHIEPNLERLAALNTHHVSEFIALEDIRTDIRHIIESHPNITVPFDFSYQFYSTIFNSIKFSYNLYKHTVYLTFEIPIYDQYQLYSVYSKPIVHDFSTFMLKTTVKYASFGTNESVLFTQEDIELLCNSYNGSKFCEKPVSSDECNTFVSTLPKTNVKNYCFDSYPIENSAIQINTNIYFSILFPTIVEVDCGNGKYPIPLYKPTNFRNMTGCSVNTEFFVYQSQFEPFSYEIAFSNKSNAEYMNWIQKFMGKNRAQQWTALVIFFIIYLFSLALIISFIYGRNRNKTLQNNTFYVSVQDTAV